MTVLPIRLLLLLYGLKVRFKQNLPLEPSSVTLRKLIHHHHLMSIFFQDLSRVWMAASQQHKVDKHFSTKFPFWGLLFNHHDTSIFVTTG